MEEFDDGFEDFLEELNTPKDLPDKRGLSDLISQENDSSLEFVLTDDIAQRKREDALRRVLSDVSPWVMLAVILVILGMTGVLQSVVGLAIKKFPFLGRLPGFSQLATLGSLVHRKGRGGCFIPIVDATDEEFDLIVLYNALCMDKRVICNPSQILQVKDFDIDYAMTITFVGYESFGEFLIVSVTSEGWFNAISQDESTKLTFRLPGSLDWSDRL